MVPLHCTSSPRHASEHKWDAAIVEVISVIYTFPDLKSVCCKKKKKKVSFSIFPVLP